MYAVTEAPFRQKTFQIPEKMKAWVLGSGIS